LYTLKANGFSPPSDKIFKEWSVSGGAKQPGDTIIVTGNVTVTALWLNTGVISGQGANPDLLVKFGIKSSGYNSHTATEVSAGFRAVQGYINKSTVSASGSDSSAKLGDIAIGDYIDLPSLNVTSDAGGGGGINLTNTDFGADGRHLRITVIGISSFAEKNGNPNEKHLVFQFQNVVGVHRMYPNDVLLEIDNGYYLNTEMRSYLNSNFLAGLIAAGVPENVLWEPVRKISKNRSGTGMESFADKIWLLTRYELSGSGAPGETSSNQARLYAYSKKNENDTGYGKNWWLASPFNGGGPEPRFNIVDREGAISGGGGGAYNAGNGVAPAFCIK
jgi:hypothetical protein